MISLCSGARETDYPAGEEVFLQSDLGLREDNGLAAANCSSDGGDSILGSITVVDCVAEGAAAVPQTADSPGREQEKSVKISVHLLLLTHSILFTIITPKPFH